MKARELAEQNGGYWGGEHPKFTVNWWICEAVNGYTRSGYWTWALAMIELDDANMMAPQPDSAGNLYGEMDE